MSGNGQQVAWLGLGNMGRGMVKNLVEKGNLSKPLIIQNRSIKRSEDMAAQLGSGKVKVVNSAAEAAKLADVIFTCLGDDAAIRDTYEAATEGDVSGKLFVECSTVLPETTEELAKLVEGKGARFCASPVFGAPAVADAGKLVFVLAGKKEVVEEVIPFTKDVMGRDYIDLSGQAYGKASTLKLIGNAFVMSNVEALAEGLTLADKSGLGVDNYHSFIELMFPFFSGYSTRMRSGDYHKREEPLFAVDLARKDAGHMMKIAKDVGTRMKNVEVIDTHFAAVQKQQGSKGDMASVYGAVRQEAGLPYQN